MSEAVTITLALDSAPLQRAFQELAARVESLYRSQLLDEKLSGQLRDLGAGVGVEKMFKTVTVPASGAYGLALQLQPSDELMGLIAELAIKQLKGRERLLEECSDTGCAAAVLRLPFEMNARTHLCACGAAFLKQGVLPPACKSPARAQAWLDLQTHTGHQSTQSLGDQPCQSAPPGSIRESCPDKAPSACQSHSQVSLASSVGEGADQATTGAQP